MTTATATPETPAQPKETRGFQAEVKQLLHLMIHSLYGNKEIFLRELISNASDAADKLRFEAIADPALLENAGELHIEISLDKAARTLTIADNGIGMSRDEVVSNIGTIARSGTREFFSKLTGDQQKDASLIGQFGVGFYSAFIVADRVTLTTRRAGAPAAEGVRWESAGDGEYTLESVERAARGTTITLHLREDAGDFLEPYRVKSVIRKYSDHIQIPIRMLADKFDAGETGEGEEKKDETPAELETVNRASALWTRAKGDITDEQYEEFYKSVSHDWEKPLAWTHNRVEGKQEYTQLLYIPAHAPFDLWDRQAKHGVKLYVRRVFIMDDAEQLLPRYLRFVRGVIDSNDLPLNVSREILQESKDVETIRGGVTRRVLSLLEDMAKNEPDKYAKFWGEFGRAFKEGAAEDFKNKEQIARLLRFTSTQSGKEDATVSFADYVARMRENQEAIYYLSADGYAAAARSPHLEVFRKKGIEVLLMTEPVDEWIMGYLTEFEGKPVKSVAKGALDLGKLDDAEEKAAQERVSELLKPFADKVKEALGDKVKEVRITHRLTDSPACLVVEEHDMSANLERLLKSAGQKVGKTAPILEVNPEHALVQKLKGDLENPSFGDWAHILFDQSVLAEGGHLEDPAAFVQRLNALMLTLAR